jgi:hypothetical protein
MNRPVASRGSLDELKLASQKDFPPSYALPDDFHDSAPASSIDGEKLQNGLARLVLVLAKLLLEVIERQAYRRVMDGSLNEQQIERLGSALMQVRSKFEEMADQFGFYSDELDLNLGSAGMQGDNRLSSTSALGLTTSLVDVIDRLIEKGTTIAGEINVSVAGIDLVVLDLLATLQPVRKTEIANGHNRKTTRSKRRSKRN